MMSDDDSMTTMVGRKNKRPRRRRRRRHRRHRHYAKSMAIATVPFIWGSVLLLLLWSSSKFRKGTTGFIIGSVDSFSFSATTIASRPSLLCRPNHNHKGPFYVHPTILPQSRLMLHKMDSHCCQERRFQRRSVVVASSNSIPVGMDDEEEEEDDGWEASADRVYDDLELLRRAVAETRADVDLKALERIAVLDEMANQRRPVWPDLVRFILGPLLASLTWFRLLVWSMMPQTQTPNFHTLVTQWVLHGAMHVGTIHFWTMVVACPLVLLYWTNNNKQSFLLQQQQQQRRHNNVVEREEDESEQVPFLDTSSLEDPEDPRTSCTDYVTCLLEQWTSCIGGAAICGLFFTVMKIVGGSPLLSLSSSLLGIMMSGVPLVTRLGAFASLHQYPKLMYELRRSTTSLHHRPLPQTTMRLDTLLKWTLLNTGVFLFGVTCDLTKFLFTIYTRIIPKPQQQQPWRQIMALQTTGTPNWLSLLTNVAFLVAMLGPICHLVALRKIWKVHYATNISLAKTYEETKEIIVEPSTKSSSSSVRLRHRLEWRTPRRVALTLRDWRRSLLAGYERPSPARRRQSRLDLGRMRQNMQLLDSTKKGRHSSVSSNYNGKTTTSTGTTATTFWNPILQLVAKDVQKAKDLGAPPPDRTRWVSDATERMAAIHQTNFENDSFDDGLGIAVHRLLGIGLSFDYDHNTRIPKDQKPSIYRLRARAAKSAIRRVQQIYKPDEARRILDDIGDDPIARNRRAGELRQEAEREVHALGHALLTLTPTNAPEPPEGVNVEVNAVLQSTTSSSPMRRRSTNPKDYVASIGDEKDEGTDLELYEKLKDQFGEESAMEFMYSNTDSSSSEHTTKTVPSQQPPVDNISSQEDELEYVEEDDNDSDDWEPEILIEEPPTDDISPSSSEWQWQRYPGSLGKEIDIENENDDEDNNDGTTTAFA